MANRMTTDQDEIDLSVLFTIFRRSIVYAVIFGGLCGLGGLLYANTLDKLYKATAQFVVEGGSSASPIQAITGLLPGISTSLGGGGSSETDRANDKIMSRDFIIGLFKTTHISEDPFFSIKNEAGLRPPQPLSDSVDLADLKKIQSIVNVYRKRVSVDVNPSGVIEVVATHMVPDTAADIANAIVSDYLDSLEDKTQKSNSRQIMLIEKRLITAQERLDSALSRARVFAVENNIASREVLGQNSLQLTQFRRKIKQLENVLAGVAFLREQTSGTINLHEVITTYPTAFPTLENRLQWSPGQSSVPRPSLRVLDNLELSLSQERSQLVRSSQILEEEAGQSAESAGRLVELDREVAVRKAIYEGLVTQFEAMNLGNDLKSEKGEWIQRASPPIVASYPKALLIAALASAIGAVLCLGFCLVMASRSGRLYTISQITQANGVRPAATQIGRAIASLNTLMLQIKTGSPQVDKVDLMGMALTLQDSQFKVVSVLSLPYTRISRHLAILLGGVMVSGNKKVAVVDLSRGRASNKAVSDFGSFEEKALSPSVNLMIWTDKSAQDKADFVSSIQSVLSSYDKVLICCAPFERNLKQNKVIFGHSDHIVLVNSKGKTTAHATQQVKFFIDKFSNAQYSVVVE